eukprot:7708063-Alexandrium_andersonii.AAC.1
MAAAPKASVSPKWLQAVSGATSPTPPLKASRVLRGDLLARLGSGEEERSLASVPSALPPPVPSSEPGPPL